MKSFELIRQNHEKPNMDLLEHLRRSLEELIYSDIDFNSDDWKKMAGQIIRFQAEDGSFNLLDSFKIESDCRVYFCYESTYICTALLMKTCLINKDFMTDEVKKVLARALDICCGRNLKGHGFDSYSGEITAINYFARCGLNEFLDMHPDICPKFTELISQIKRIYAQCIEQKRFYGDWGESYKAAIMKINAYFRKEKYVFVYGTLMKGQANHNHYLSDNQYAGDASIEGYDIYDLGYYPGIIAGEGNVQGEVYLVDAETELALDRLEGEGSLYIKTPVTAVMEDGTQLEALVYVYNRSVQGCPKVKGRYGDKEVNEEYVWYVSYGSNLLEERIKYYIQGGHCIYNGRSYNEHCSDTTMPSESKPIMIPYDMYYSNYDMGSWKKSAVCFLDLTKPGKAYGKAYKILKSQLNDIHRQEGRGQSWYPDLVQLDDIDNIPAYTCAGYRVKKKEAFDKVSFEYGLVLYKGMKETYPEMTDKEILDYLRGCGGPEQ